MEVQWEHLAKIMLQDKYQIQELPLEQVNFFVKMEHGKNLLVETEEEMFL
jgi:hypothetical protein